MSQPVSPPPPEGWVAALINAVKGLTLTNVVIIALLVLILVPVYVVYKALSDATLMDRLLSNFKEMPSSTSCTLREARERGGPEIWAVSTGFAYAGSDKWVVSVVLPHEPSPEQVVSYCAAAQHIVDTMHTPPP